ASPASPGWRTRGSAPPRESPGWRVRVPGPDARAACSGRRPLVFALLARGTSWLIPLVGLGVPRRASRFARTERAIRCTAAICQRYACYLDQRAAHHCMVSIDRRLDDHPDGSSLPSARSWAIVAPAASSCGYVSCTQSSRSRFALTAIEVAH